MEEVAGGVVVAAGEKGAPRELVNLLGGGGEMEAWCAVMRIQKRIGQITTSTVTTTMPAGSQPPPPPITTKYTSRYIPI